MSTTGFEYRIAAYAAEHEITISRGKVQRLALRLSKRMDRLSDETLERVFMHSDPTPKLAIRNIEREAVAA